MLSVNRVVRQSDDDERLQQQVAEEVRRSVGPQSTPAGRQARHEA